MAKQTINIGSAANDGTGTTHRASFDICNDNFTELYDGKQDIDADLTAIAGLTPSNDDILQRKAGAWANRTVAQVATDLQTPLGSVYQGLDADLTAIAGLSATNDDIIQRKAGAWANRTVVQVATDLQTPFDSRYQALDADLTAFAGLSATNDDFVQRKAGAWTNRTVAQVQADLGIDSTTTSVYYAIDNGITTGGSGAANTAALQSLVNTVSAAGGGVIQFDYGTYNFNYTGTSPWAAYSANRYAVQFKSGVYLRGKGRVNGTKLRLADVQMAGTTNGVHLFTAGDGCDGFGFLNLELDGNAAGQSGWSGGYSQGAAHSTGLSTEPNDTGNPNIYNFICRDVYAHGWYSSAIELYELENATCQNIKIDACGEGLAFVRSTNGFVTGFEYLNTGGVSPGDAFESSGGDNITLLDATFTGGTGGAAIDMATRNFRMDNIIIRNHAGTAITIQPEGGNDLLDNPNGIVSNVTIEDSTLGISIHMNDVADDAHVTLSDCRVLRSSDRGFLVQKHSGTPYGSGQVTLSNCVARECTNQGLYAMICRVTVSGGDYSENGDSGIYLQPLNLTASDDVQYHISGPTCINNGGHGIYCNTAAFVPRLQISAYCEGNAAGLTYNDKYCQMSIPFPTSTDVFAENLRPVQTSAWNGTNTINVCGERVVRIVSGPLGDIVGGKNGQILTLYADTNPITIYDKTSAEGLIHFGGGPCNINCFDAINTVMQVGETTTFQYRASTQEWTQIGASAGRKRLSLSPTIIADGGVIITANPPTDNAASAYYLASTGSRSLIGRVVRNMYASGQVYSRDWTNAGDINYNLTDGTNEFSTGLDTSAAQWKVSASGTLGTTDAIAADASATATHTRFFLYDVDKGAMQRVLVGAADSGGTGYKMLRVVN